MSKKRIPINWTVASVVVAALALVAGGIYFYTGNCRENLENCIVDRNAAQKEVAALEATLDSMFEKQGTPIVETVEATRIVTVEVPVPVCDLQLCATPTPIPIECNAQLSNTPCLKILQPGDTWHGIAEKSPLGDYCRYPEILTINRRVDGTYPRLSGADNDIYKAIVIPSFASKGTYRPRIRNEQGGFEDIHPCSDGGLPCLYVVDKSLNIFDYAQLSQLMYQNNIFGENIELANLESDCSGRGVRLRLGAEIVIPKRPALEPE